MPRRKKPNSMMVELHELHEKSIVTLEEFRKQREKFGRPFIIEVCGTPRSGKTMVIRKALRRFLRETGWRLSLPQEGAERIETPRKDGFLYNLHTAVYALDRLLYARHDHNVDLVILDRAIFDAVMRVVYWFDEGEINQETCHIATEFYLLPKICELIDKYIILICSPEVALRREDEFALTTKRSNSVNKKSLEKLLHLHNLILPRFQERKADVSMVNTSELNMREEGIIVADLILDAVSNKMRF